MDDGDGASGTHGATGPLARLILVSGRPYDAVMTSPIRVLLVDDDPLVRSGLTFLLRSADDIEVVGEVGDGDEVVAAVQRLSPQVLLMDLRMPRVDGVSATAAVRALPSPPEVLVLTTWDVDDAVVRSIEAGASGFLLKTAAPTEIMAAIRAVGQGDSVLSPRSTRQLLNHMVGSDDLGARREAQGRIGSLTEREMEVAAAVGRGLSNSEIAGELFVSEATVKSQLSTIQMKLDVRNRVGIAVLAERAGLLRS